VGLRFRAEFFNIFNHPNFDNANNTLSIGLDSNDAVWLELLVLNAFESEEDCIGYVQNPGTQVP
jgi:hypothetical protein